MSAARDTLTDERTPDSIREARAMFVAQLRDVDLTEQEQSTVTWLLGWDQPTLNDLASVVYKARALGPVTR